MSNSNQEINKHPQFKNLPPELRNHLQLFNNKGYIADDILLKGLFNPVFNQQVDYDFLVKILNDSLTNKIG